MTLRGNGNVAYYCFIVALGLKSNNHETLERIFSEELTVLSEPNKYYSGKHKINFLAALNLTASIRDRPARCKINGLRHHNGYLPNLHSGLPSWILLSRLNRVKFAFLKGEES